MAYRWALIGCAGYMLLAGAAQGAEPALPLVEGLEPQPALAMAARVIEAMGMLGAEVPAADAARIAALAQAGGDAAAVTEVQGLLDAYCLAGVHINPEARVKAQRGAAAAHLVQGGWRVFLVKVHNEGRVRGALEAVSPSAEPVLHRSTGSPEPKPENAIAPEEVDRRFLELAFYEGRPLSRALSGFPLEYKVLQVFTKDAGDREVRVGFHIGPGTEDLALRNALDILFDCAPAVPVTVRVRDHDGAPAMASFVFRDNIDRFSKSKEDQKPERDYRELMAQGDNFPTLSDGQYPLVGLYPLPGRRVASRDPYPDFFFQPQVYRSDGETVLLPPGRYDVVWTRGPEYVQGARTIEVPAGAASHEESFQLERWIELAALGWISGDHHVHGGGCSHYESPVAGVGPEAMFRQSLGEDLNVSCVLSWGPCWYYQKQFFEGRTHALSKPRYTMRYDVEVSGFPSSHAGHLCLLRLSEDDYPGTTRIEEWPSYTLPVLEWAKKQGGITGYAHTGWGLAPLEPTFELPNYVIPHYDGIGANEYIVTVTHGLCDFISAGNTPALWELNMWYHTLNCGFGTAISGETDYPCIYDERIGMARSYVKLPRNWEYDGFAEGIRRGASYVTDGRAHILDFTVAAGRRKAVLGGARHAVDLAGPRRVAVTARVAALLPESQSARGKQIQDGGILGGPSWHLEKARIPGTRNVPVDLVVNGYAVARQEVTADGQWHEVRFEHDIAHSSWTALRILPAAHTNPIVVTVGGQPVRASKRSAKWCREGIEQCWSMKAPAIREGEREAARAAYDHARKAYDAIFAAAVDDLAVPAPSVLAVPRSLPIPAGATAVLPTAPEVLRSSGWMTLAYDASTFTDMAYWCPKGDGAERFRWTLDHLPAGRYRLSAWTPDDPNRDHAPDAAYRIVHADGASPAVVDQHRETRRFKPLGEFRLGPGSYVELTNRAAGNLVADAILAEPIP